MSAKNDLMSVSTLTLVAAFLSDAITPAQEAELRRRGKPNVESIRISDIAVATMDGGYPKGHLALLLRWRQGDAAAKALYETAHADWEKGRNSKPAAAKPAAAPAATAAPKPAKVSATLAAINALAADFQSFRTEASARFERIEADLARKANSRAKRG
jgi:hypothetical protein